MEAINALGEDLTQLLIAHRLSTLKDCDVVYRLAHGKIVESGTYAQMCLEESKSDDIKNSKE